VLQPKSFAPHRAEAGARATKSGERLFDFVRGWNGAPISCELLDNRQGIVVRFLERGQVYCRRAGFPTRELAVRWAEAERKAMEAP
jgi:hypothetical protein